MTQTHPNDVNDPVPDATEAANAPNAMELPLRDAWESGWFQREAGELFKGFPISADDVVLDAGCGDGGNAQFCVRAGATVIVADIDPAALAEAVKRLGGTTDQPVRALLTDSNPLPLRDGTVSAVVCSEVIEHVDDPIAFLSELVRVGRSGARYFLTVPDPVIEELFRPCAAPNYFEHPNHLRIIQNDEFERMVADAGLVVETRDTYGAYWSIWWMLAWAAGPNWPDDLRPVVEPWDETWRAVLDTPRGRELKRAFDDLIPRSQLILARKP
jgi:ubiquinone/menaquinone biosynthesis C-methylase UbiE